MLISNPELEYCSWSTSSVLFSSVVEQCVFVCLCVRACLLERVSYPGDWEVGGVSYFAWCRSRAAGWGHRWWGLVSRAWCRPSWPAPPHCCSSRGSPRTAAAPRCPSGLGCLPQWTETWSRAKRRDTIQWNVCAVGMEWFTRDTIRITIQHYFKPG